MGTQAAAKRTVNNEHGYAALGTTVTILAALAVAALIAALAIQGALPTDTQTGTVIANSTALPVGEHLPNTLFLFTLTTSSLALCLMFAAWLNTSHTQRSGEQKA